MILNRNNSINDGFLMPLISSPITAKADDNFRHQALNPMK